MAILTTHSVPSGPPQNFAITYHLTSTTAVLSWSPPLLLQRNGVITSYYVVCIIGNVTGDVRISSTTVELALEPFTSYKCSVSATNAIGDGPSASISGLSNEDSKYPNIIMTHDNKFDCVCLQFLDLLLNLWEFLRVQHQLYSLGVLLCNRMVLLLATSYSVGLQ